MPMYITFTSFMQEHCTPDFLDFVENNVSQYRTSVTTFAIVNFKLHWRFSKALWDNFCREKNYIFRVIQLSRINSKLPLSKIFQNLHKQLGKIYLTYIKAGQSLDSRRDNSKKAKTLWQCC